MFLLRWAFVAAGPATSAVGVVADMTSRACKTGVSCDVARHAHSGDSAISERDALINERSIAPSLYGHDQLYRPK